MSNLKPAIKYTVYITKPLFYDIIKVGAITNRLRNGFRVVRVVTQLIKNYLFFFSKIDKQLVKITEDILRIVDQYHKHSTISIIYHSSSSKLMSTLI